MVERQRRRLHEVVVLPLSTRAARARDRLGPMSCAASAPDTGTDAHPAVGPASLPNDMADGQRGGPPTRVEALRHSELPSLRDLATAHSGQHRVVTGVLHHRVLEAVYRAVDDINDVLPREQHVAKSLDTQLLGREARFDSLGLVSLIVNVEERVIEEFQVALILGDEQAMSQRRSPFRTLGTLVEYVEARLVEAGIA